MDGRKHDAEHHPSRRVEDDAHLRMTAEVVSKALMLDRREVIVVDAQPVMARPADPQLTLDPMKPGGGDQFQRGAEQRLGAVKGAAGMGTTGLFRRSREAILAGAALRRQVEQPVLGQTETNHLGHSVAADAPRADHKMRRPPYEFESIRSASA